MSAIPGILSVYPGNLHTLFCVNISRRISAISTGYKIEVNSTYRPFPGDGRLYFFDEVPEPVLQRKGRKGSTQLTEPRYSLRMADRYLMSGSSGVCWFLIVSTATDKAKSHPWCCPVWRRSAAPNDVVMLAAPMRTSAIVAVSDCC